MSLATYSTAMMSAERAGTVLHVNCPYLRACGPGPDAPTHRTCRRCIGILLPDWVKGGTVSPSSRCPQSPATRFPGLTNPTRRACSGSNILGLHHLVAASTCRSTRVGDAECATRDEVQSLPSAVRAQPRVRKVRNGVFQPFGREKHLTTPV